MARVSKRSFIFFRLSPAEQINTLCFGVEQGKIRKRFDPNFYLPNPNLLEHYSFPLAYEHLTLDELATNIIQPKEFMRQYVDQSINSIPCLRAANVRDGELNLSDLVFLSNDVINASHKAFESSFIKEGDILVTRTGAKAGEVCRVPHLNREFIVSSHTIRIIPDKEKIDPKYFELFLLSRWGKAQIYRLLTGAAQKQLQLASIATIEVIIPPLNKQIELVTAMDEARSHRKQKLAEADALLSSFDDYLLNTLGLEPPVKDERKVFAIQTSIISGRFDPHFHAPNFKNIYRLLSKTTTKKLGEIVKFSKDYWNPKDEEKITFRYIEISNVKPQTGEAIWTETLTKEAPSRARMLVHGDDIIVSLTRPHHGSIAHLSEEFNSCIASTGFAVIRSVSKLVNREYLWCILRSQISLQQMLQRSSGGNYPAITKTELENIIIPVPEIFIQERIVTEIQRRRSEAQRLRSEAETGWQSAKQWFEDQLLGGS